MTEQSSTGRTWRPEPLGLLWRFFAAPPTLLVLSALLALSLVLGTLIPQIPAEAAANPRAWLAVQPGALGRSNSLIQALGLFDLYHAVWFRALLALIGLSLFVWTAESAEIAWRAGRGRWAPDSLALLGRHPLHASVSSPGDAGDTQARLHDFLARHRYHWAAVGGEPAANLVAGYRSALWWTQPAGYGGLLLALIGLAVVATIGWHSPNWQPAAGETLAVGHNTALGVRLDAFGPPAPSPGLPPRQVGAESYHSRITWLNGTQVVDQADVAAGHPAAWHGLALRQVGAAPAITIRGQNENGQALSFQAAEEAANPTREITVSFAQPGTQHLILIPNKDLFLLLALEQAPAGAQPALRISLLNSAEGEQQTLAVLSQSGVLAVDGLKVNVDVSYRPVLRLDYRPGMGLVIGGLALAIVALAIGWLVRPRLLWLAIGPGADCPAMVHVLAMGGSGQASWFSRLAAHLREALADVA